MSEKQLKREAKKAEKKAKKAEKKAKKEEYKSKGDTTQGKDATSSEADPIEDVSIGKYGNLPMNQSREKLSRQFIDIGILGPKLGGQEVWVRARLHTSRAKGEVGFHRVSSFATRFRFIEGKSVPP